MRPGHSTVVIAGSASRWRDVETRDLHGRDGRRCIGELVAAGEAGGGRSISPTFVLIDQPAVFLKARKSWPKSRIGAVRAVRRSRSSTSCAASVSWEPMTTGGPA